MLFKDFLYLTNVIIKLRSSLWSYLSLSLEILRVIRATCSFNYELLCEGTFEGGSRNSSNILMIISKQFLSLQSFSPIHKGSDINSINNFLRIWKLPTELNKSIQAISDWKTFINSISIYHMWMSLKNFNDAKAFELYYVSILIKKYFIKKIRPLKNYLPE